MAQYEREGVESTASIASHPIHPMLIPFPIAFLVGGFITDLAYWYTLSSFWASASLWLIGAGFVTGIIAAGVGLIDFFTIQRARDHSAGWIHFVGNAVVLVLAFITLLLRTADVEGAVLPSGLIVSGVITVLLVVTGWYGGELTYRYKIGVLEEQEPISTGS